MSRWDPSASWMRWYAILIGFASTTLCTRAVLFALPRRRVALLHQARLREPQQSAIIGSYGFDENGQDLTIAPGNDFFGFANGKYVEELVIPEDQSSWGSFDILNNQSLVKVRGILEDDMMHGCCGGKIGDFYASFMNQSLVDDLDDSPLQSTLAEIRAIRDSSDYASLVGRSVRGYLPSPFNVYITPDAKNIKSYCVMVDQAGLGLPRDYYLNPAFANKTAAYKKHAAELLHMVGWPDANSSAEQICSLEAKIANVSWSEAEQRDPLKNYNKMNDVIDLQSHAPGFDWAIFLKEAGNLPNGSNLVVGAIGGVAGIAKILNETDLAVLRSYTAFHLVSGVATILSERFVNASFEFAKVLSGQERISPRWKRAVQSLNGRMGEAVGEEFVKRYFPESSKRQAQKLTVHLTEVFKRRIEKVDWMTNTTKENALTKLASFDAQIGYPNKFRNYKSLRVNASDLYGNIERSIAFDWEYDLSRLGKEVDRGEWAMTPQTVNAYYMPEFNQIVFPAAILQPPFFDPQADMAVNFGGIGGVIGHEMTHGFDDEGRQYDKDGQLNDWWTDDDAKAFKERADAYGKQFLEFDVGILDAHIKSNLTMGEDIADLGGMNLALDAYNAYCAEKGQSVTSDSHMIGVRRVFLGWAQVWRKKQTVDSLLNLLASDPHPPAEARVNIPPRNIDVWYEAFDVKQDQTLFLEPEDRVRIW